MTARKLENLFLNALFTKFKLSVMTMVMMTMVVMTMMVMTMVMMVTMVVMAMMVMAMMVMAMMVMAMMVMMAMMMTVMVMAIIVRIEGWCIPSLVIVVTRIIPIILIIVARPTYISVKKLSFIHVISLLLEILHHSVCVNNQLCYSHLPK